MDDVKDVLLSQGELGKDDIQRLWQLDEEQYAELKLLFDHEKLIEPGPRGRGGFVVRVGRRALPPDESMEAGFVVQRSWEAQAVERLAALFSHAELEAFLRDLVYTVRRARTQRPALGYQAFRAIWQLRRLRVDTPP